MSPWTIPGLLSVATRCNSFAVLWRIKCWKKSCTSLAFKCASCLALCLSCTLPKGAPHCLGCLKVPHPWKGWGLCLPEGKSCRAGEKRLTLCDNLLYILCGFLELPHLHLDGVCPHRLLQKRTVRVRRGAQSSALAAPKCCCSPEPWGCFGRADGRASSREQLIFGGRNPRSTAGCHHGGFPEHHNGRCPSPLLSPGRWVPRWGDVEEEQGHLPLWWGPRSPPSHRAGPPAAGEKDRELGTLGTTAPLG